MVQVLARVHERVEGVDGADDLEADGVGRLVAPHLDVDERAGVVREDVGPQHVEWAVGDVDGVTAVAGSAAPDAVRTGVVGWALSVLPGEARGGAGPTGEVLGHLGLGRRILGVQHLETALGPELLGAGGHQGVELAPTITYASLGMVDVHARVLHLLDEFARGARHDDLDRARHGRECRQASDLGGVVVAGGRRHEGQRQHHLQPQPHRRTRPRRHARPPGRRHRGGRASPYAMGPALPTCGLV